MSQSSLPEAVVATTTMLGSFTKTLMPLLTSIQSAASRSITVVPQASITLHPGGPVTIVVRTKLSIRPSGTDSEERQDRLEMRR